MSVEILPAKNSISRHPVQGFELSSSLRDGAARMQDDGGRRVLECAPFPKGADVQVCVAAWHGVLHWLRYNDEPVITCMLGAQDHKCWPVITTAGAETSLGELLDRVRQQWMHEERGWLDLRDPSHSGLHDQLRCHAIRLHDSAVQDEARAEFEIVLAQGHWRVNCAASRFSEPYQRHVMALWRQLITKMLRRPESVLSAETYRDTGVAGPSIHITGNLIDRFLTLTSLHPHKPAIVDAQGSVSYSELDALSSAWAQVLCMAGVAPGDYVGVAFNRSHKVVAAQLAILRTGAVFVPMDAAQPAGRLKAMAEDTDMRVVLTEAACMASMTKALPEVRCLPVEDLPVSASVTFEYSQPQISTDDLAYVIFTSGSTGRPKGVKVSHGNLLNFVSHLAPYLSSDDTMSQFAPFTFDASVGEVYTSLLNGCCLVMLSSELIDDPERLQTYLTEQRVTFAVFPPQYAKHLSPEKLPYVKSLLTAGSAPDRELIKRWQPHVRYWNAYGPTETTILSTAWPANHLPEAHDPIVIGSPISNTEVRVVNRFNQSLPHGAIGELLIGGAGVTHGYIKREELTRERFITDGRTRWYRSGDLCCFDENDELIFSGRVDNQIKLRGHRLEPGEVEAALSSLPGVEQAAVLVVQVESANQLVAFCAGEPQPEELVRQRLRSALPAWALPNRILWLASLPHTVNGKTDYRELRQQLSRLDEKARAQDYENDLEAQVAAVWRSVLQQPYISREDNFIHLGGDSLTALVVMSSLRKMGFQISSSQLLAHPRLADFATLLAHTGRRAREDYSSCQGVAPLSPIQAWFFSLRLANPGEFCQTLVIEADGRLDADRLQRALWMLTAYHDQLRACFTCAQGSSPDVPAWRQEILSDTLERPAIAVTDLPEEQLADACERYRKTLAAELSIEHEPLFRVALLRTPTRSRVVWVIHHLIVDTLSHSILLDDLHHLYSSNIADFEQVLPGKSISYMGWSNKLLSEVNDQASALLERWRPQLHAVSQADPLPLTRDATRSGAPVEVCVCRLSQDETTGLIERATACYRQSPEELVLAATYLALARTFKLQNVAIDVEWHGRDETFAGPQGIDRSVGWFTSVHPLCVTVSPECDLGPWLIELKQTRAGIVNRGREFYALRYLSLDASVREAFSHYRQPEVLFNFSGVVQRRHGGWRTVPVVAIEMGDSNANPYAMSVESEIREGKLAVSIYSRPECWPEGVADRFALALTECLRNVVQHCSVPENRRWTPADFPLASLTQAHVDQLPQSIKTAYPLTDMQQTMLRHRDTYRVFMSHRIPRRLDEPQWRAAVAEWIERHDCLRTFIKEWDGVEACQVVLESLPAPLTFHRAEPGEGREKVAALIRQARSAPVDLAQAPLFQLQVIDEGRDEFLILLGIHHIIHDGWSIELLLNDLFQTYRRLLSETDRKPDAPLASVADIVAQQRHLQASADWRAYWPELPWEHTAAQLPCGSQRRTGSGPADAQQRNTQIYLDTIDPRLVAVVSQRAKALGVTINSLWLTGYVCLLRYLGAQPQVRCGIVQTGRMEEIPGVATITGCCVNTLPLVLSIPSTHSLTDVVAAVNDQLEKMRAAAAFPLSWIHEAVRHRLGDEMFATLFNIESHRYGGPTERERPVLEGGHEATNYAFVFSLIEQAPPAYQIRIGYDADLYDTATIASWLEIYAHCMGLLVHQSQHPWGDLRLLPPRLRQQLVNDWNQTTAEFSQDRCVHELIADQAARTPDAVAVVYEKQKLSYAELNASANRLAHYLRKLGVKPDARVAICAKRSPEMLVGLLAVLKAGGAYVPLDPAYPDERLAYMLEDSAPAVLLTHRSLDVHKLARAKADLPVLFLDQLEPPWTDEPAADPDRSQVALTPAHLAYVIYTSGSTGKPKGVMIEHAGLTNYLQWALRAYEPQTGEGSVVASSIAFDATITSLYTPLLCGRPVVLVREGEEIEGLEQLLRQPTAWSLIKITPSHLNALGQRLLAERSESHAFRKRAESAMGDFLQSEKRTCAARAFVVGGEALPASTVRLWRSIAPEARIINEYGPTETVVGCCTYEVPHHEALGHSVPIGRPIANTRMYLLDADRQPVPIGVTGEIYIAGAGVARGYLNRPELTAERFVDDPFVHEQRARMYRTGDLGRWQADGTIEYLGRNDHQVKVRGFRVELGEIEAQLAGYPGVREVVVLAREDGNSEKRLVAYLTADGRPGVEALRAHLLNDLPEYMVPAAFVMLDSMPWNANGKIDRDRLPEPDASAYARNALVEAETEHERLLWSIWKDVLGFDAFGVNDNFFAVGGDSILAIQVAARAAQHGLVIQTRHIIEAKTIRKLASRFSGPLEKKATSAPRAEPAGTPLRNDTACRGEQRLLPIQMKFLEDRTDANQYDQYAFITLPDEVDERMLRSALQAIVAKHDVLRLKFRETPKGWIAHYRPELLAGATDPADEILTEENLAELPCEWRGAWAADAAAEAHTALDIKQGRLCKWVWFRECKRQQLLWIMHHLVVDAVSWGVLLQDLQTALAQCLRGESPSLELSSGSYQEWAARLHEHAFSPSLEQEKGYWLSQLTQPGARIPVECNDADEANTACLEVALSAQETSRLLYEANRSYDTQTRQLLIAALARALGAWLSSDAVRIDLEGHGREAMEGEELFAGLDVGQTVGWFTTIYPTHLGGMQAELAAHIRKVREQLDAVPNNGIGYGVLSYLTHDEELYAAREQLGFREADVLFNFLGQMGGGEQGGSSISPRRLRSHPLRINGMIQDGVLTFRIDYSSRQLAQGAVEAFADRFIQTLRELIEHCAAVSASAPLGGPGSEARPAQFPLSGLSQADIATLRTKYPTLQDIYPCTGMQQGLLLFTAREPQSGLYLTQIRIALEGVDAARLHRSWLTLSSRHSILRTAFADVGQSCLYQVVLAHAEPPWRELDVRSREQAEVERLLSEERTQPFDVSAAPLMRLLLVQVSDERYCLAWTYHHALIDGWSMANLVKELFEIYADSVSPGLPAPSRTQTPAYRSYLEWLQSRDHEAAGRYWASYFTGVDVGASASLPVSKDGAAKSSRAQSDGYEQKACTIELPASVTARLSQLARGEGVGMSTLMLAAWSLLLSKYNSEQQVLFGYTTSGRPPDLAGVESMAGLFINSLPLCVKVNAGQTLAAWLADIQRVQLDHDDHSFVALADIQRYGGVSAGQTAFDSLVVVENYPLDRSLLSSKQRGGLRLIDVEGVEQNNFGLNLIVYPGERLTLKLVYRATQFDDAAMATMLRYLSQLLVSFGKGSAQAISELSILTDEERDRAIHRWNDSARVYPSDRSVPDLFEAQASARGGAYALITSTERWTYRRLAARVRAITAWLIEKGVKPGDKVALSLEKEPDLIAAMLGIMRAGAAYVPIALDCPLERRSFIAADAGIKFVVTRKAHREQIDVPNVQALLLDECPAGSSRAWKLLGGTDRSPCKAGAKSSAYVIYTSGTTGTPKGVSVSHRNLINFCYWCREVDLHGRGYRTTQFAPYTFDASAGEIFSALLAGAELHLLSEELIHDPRALAQYLADRKIRFSAFPPPYLQQMDPALVPERLSILTGGSAPALDLVRRWGARVRYINGYGPTETTILSSAWISDGSSLDDGRPLSIGRPINNTSIYVVDQVGQLCAPGLIGEIYIGGDGVAEGYLKRPELTNQQFIADPFKPGGRVYRTGDLGRWRDDGCIEFVGRRDRQVKLRGFRVELSEIEGRIRQHPAVKDAAVLVRGENDDQHLLAWVVHASGLARDTKQAAEFTEALRAFVRKALPEYMVPQAILLMEQLPLTVNGKLDEKALPQPDSTELFTQRYVAPRSATEQRVAQIWASVLKLRPEQISSTANFFELGGQSLLAMRVIARMREELSVNISVADLFARPVLADLTAQVQDSAPDELPPITPVGRDTLLPLSFAQRRLWFLAQMAGVSESYHIPSALKLTGTLNRTALRRALDRIVARHEALRTTFELVDGEPCQRITAPDCGFSLQEHDLRGEPDADETLQRLMTEEALAPFDLTTGPLMRGRLVRLHQDEHILLVTTHHIVTDGWSMGVLIHELSTLYRAYRAGEADPLPELAIQYGDYSAWQTRWLTDAALREQGEYWRSTLRGAPALLELPTDRPRPAEQEYAGDVVPLELDKNLTAGLRALSRRHGTTLFMTVLAAWSAVLSRLSGQQDVVIGTPVANRTQVEVEPLIGFFVNTLALRVDASGTPTLSDLLERVRAHVLEAQKHQQLPFEQVVELVQPPRSLAYTSIFQVMFNWQTDELGALDLPGLTAVPVRPGYVPSKFDMTLDLCESDEHIIGSVEYAIALWDRGTIERHIGYLRRMLQAMVADENQLVHRLELLGDDERRLLLQDFNDTRKPDLIDLTWPELFEAQVARTPKNVCVQCESQQLTYLELHERSNRLARALKQQGAAPGQIVALLDQRGTDLLVMIVAVLKAGAAYVPLDPTHPLPRWLEILDEARPLLLWVGDSLQVEQRWLKRNLTTTAVRNTADLLEVPVDAAEELRYPALDDLAYVLFTSGSTGKPKGVMIEHRGMINNMRSKFEPLTLTAADVIAQTASQCFDISVWQFLTAPLLGAKVLIVSSEVTRDPQALLTQLAEEGVTVWEAVPSLIQAALPFCRALPAMRWVLPTGEALSRELVARWFDRYPDIPLMNAYGPAECSDDVSFQPMHAPVERVLIGRPVANAHLHIVDENLLLVPLGVVGELAVSGPVVGRGYLNRPDETRAAFRENPYARDAADQRIYLTGDLARRWCDGSVEYIGRKDFQVKIRGFRIELGEIESCLSRHAGVIEAVVVAHESDRGDKQLVAYVTVADVTLESAAVSPDSLRAHVRSALPDYMVPGAVIMLDTLPLTANGKVDRKALPAPSLSAFQSAAYEAPQSETECVLAQVWQDVLRLERVGRRDDFFDLGGNSILIIRMISLLKEQGLTLNVVDIYQLRTVEACAAALAAKVRGSQSVLHHKQDISSALPDGPVQDESQLVDELATQLDAFERAFVQLEPDETFPFSPIQREFLQWRSRDVLTAITVRGRFSAEELKHAFHRLACEQDLLRAIADPTRAQWQLLHAQSLESACPCVNLRGAHGVKAGALVDKLLAQLIRKQRESGLPYVPMWVSSSDTEHHLVLANDHLISDGTTAIVLENRLTAFLNGSAKPVTRTYRDYVQDAWRSADQRTYDLVAERFNYAELARAIRGTQTALARRRQLSQHDVRLRVALDADSGASALDQAFECFKRAAMSVTGLSTLGVVVHQYGRQLGSVSYFEQAGLFLDKIPFAVSSATKLPELSGPLDYLRKNGINLIALEQAPGVRRRFALPGLADEMMFNFISDTPGPSFGTSSAIEADRAASLRDHRGFMFEAYSEDAALVIHCVFRGDPADIDAVTEAVCGRSERTGVESPADAYDLA